MLDRLASKATSINSGKRHRHSLFGALEVREVVVRCHCKVAARCLQAQAVAAATSLGQEVRSCFVLAVHGSVLTSLSRYDYMDNWAAKLVALTWEPPKQEQGMSERPVEEPVQWSIAKQGVVLSLHGIAVRSMMVFCCCGVDTSAALSGAV